VGPSVSSNAAVGSAADPDARFAEVKRERRKERSATAEREPSGLEIAPPPSRPC
jgi:hypothetical protein